MLTSSVATNCFRGGPRGSILYIKRPVNFQPWPRTVYISILYHTEHTERARMRATGTHKNGTMAAPYGGAGRVLSPLAVRTRGRRTAAHAALLLQLRSLPWIVEEIKGGRARKTRSQPPAGRRQRRHKSINLRCFKRRSRVDRRKTTWTERESKQVSVRNGKERKQESR